MPTSPEDYNLGRRMKRRRTTWEAANPERLATVGTSPTGSNVPAATYREKGRKLPVKDTGRGLYDRQLPGMAEQLGQFPTPTRWEDLSPEQQAKTHAGLKRYGTSLDTMKSDFGSHVDQAFARAEKGGAEHPYGADFYEAEGAPRQRIKEAGIGVPPSHFSAAVAITSPQARFTSREGLPDEYHPNINNAIAAVRHAQAGTPLEDVKTPGLEVPQRERGQGFHKNIRKAVGGLRQGAEGVPAPEWRNPPSKTNPKGTPMFGKETAPKIGPFANAFDDLAEQFFVSDVHSGGGGMLPHLSSDKPLTGELTKTGKEVRSDSEREQAINAIPHFHAAADFAARGAAYERGLPSLRATQATQWSEERLQRHEAKGGGQGSQNFISPERAYPGVTSAKMPHTLEVPGQMSFDFDAPEVRSGGKGEAKGRRPRSVR